MPTKLRQDWSDKARCDGKKDAVNYKLYSNNMGRICLRWVLAKRPIIWKRDPSHRCSKHNKLH